MVDEIIRVGSYTDSIDPRKSDKVEDKKGSTWKDAKITENDASEDSVNISSEAKQKLDKARLINTVKNLPEVREEKVIEARGKVESGELFSPEVTEKLADELDNIL